MAALLKHISPLICISDICCKFDSQFPTFHLSIVPLQQVVELANCELLLFTNLLTGFWNGDIMQVIWLQNFPYLFILIQAISHVGRNYFIPELLASNGRFCYLFRFGWFLDFLRGLDRLQIRLELFFLWLHKLCFFFRKINERDHFCFLGIRYQIFRLLQGLKQNSSFIYSSLQFRAQSARMQFPLVIIILDNFAQRQMCIALGIAKKIHSKHAFLARFASNRYLTWPPYSICIPTPYQILITKGLLFLLIL